MQTDHAPAAPQAPLPTSLPEAEGLAIRIVMYDAAGRPRSGRILRLSDCLAALPPSLGRVA